MKDKIAALIKWATEDQKLNRYGSPAFMKREGYIEALRDVQKIFVVNE